MTAISQTIESQGVAEFLGTATYTPPDEAAAKAVAALERDVRKAVEWINICVSHYENYSVPKWYERDVKSGKTRRPPSPED